MTAVAASASALGGSMDLSYIVPMIAAGQAGVPDQEL